MTNLPTYELNNGLSNADLLAIGDIDGDGKLTNVDVQALISLVANSESAAGAATAVPEPAAVILLALGAVMFCVRLLRIDVKTAV